MKKNIFNICKVIGLFLLFFSISYIPILLFNIDVSKFDDLDFIVYSFCCNIVFLIIIVLCYFKTLKKDFKPYFRNFASNIEESFKYYIIGLGIMIVSNFIITFVIGGSTSENEEFIRNSISLAPFLMLVEVSLYAPFSEELLFRKSIRELIDNKWMYVLVSGLIFGGLHVVGSQSLIEYLYLIPYCGLGCTFAYIYAKSDNIYSTITIHAIHNTIAIILYFWGASV